jgi:hypothetical protein
MQGLDGRDRLLALFSRTTGSWWRGTKEGIESGDEIGTDTAKMRFRQDPK